jgi:hypothetical protein
MREEGEASREGDGVKKRRVRIPRSSDSNVLRRARERL